MSSIYTKREVHWMLESVKGRLLAPGTSNMELRSTIDNTLEHTQSLINEVVQTRPSPKEQERLLKEFLESET